jgi:DNA-directed RNA polymerase subunit RPC12/RpoP
MRIESLDCNKCGAPLEVPENVNFVRCGHCGARLKVHREKAAHYTEVLDQIQESTRALRNEVQVLRLQNELRDLDEAWRMRREKLMVHDKHGRASKPSAVVGVIMGAIGVLGGIVWIAVTSSAMPDRSSAIVSGPGRGFPRSGAAPFDSGPSFDFFSLFPLFGVVIILVGVIGAVYMIVRANEFSQAEAKYMARRRSLEEEIARARSG